MNNTNKISVSTKFSFIYLSFIVFLGIFSNYINQFSHSIPSGLPLVSPNFYHWFGTDDLGIDIFSQISFGAKNSLTIAFFSSFISTFISIILGISSAYYGGKIDKLIMRICNIILSLPQLPLMIVLSSFFSPSQINLVFIIVLFSFVMSTRTIRSKIMFLKKEKYIVSAENFGANLFYLTIHHFIPEIFPLLIINIIKITSKAIIMESSLAFLGLGDPLSKSWGMIINRALGFPGIYFTDYWKWWLAIPILLLTLLITSIGLISRDVEKIFNKKL